MSPPLFKVYDKVWVMRNSVPREMKVFAVIESADYWKTRTELAYRVVDSMLGAGWGNNEGDMYQAGSVFATKEELLKSL